MKPTRNSTQFKRDFKKLQKAGKDMTKLIDVMKLICEEKPLPDMYQDHPLQGEWHGFRDCHIEPDWVLIYCIYPDRIRFERTGSHSELFG